DDDLAVRAAMGMRVVLGRRSVRRPARMTDPDGGIERMPVQLLELGLDPDQTPRALSDLHAPLGVLQRDSGAVVTAILEPPRSIEQDVRSVLLSDVTHDSTHVRTPVFSLNRLEGVKGRRASRRTNARAPRETPPASRR